MSDLNTLVSYLFEGSVNVEDASVKSESIKAGELPNTADQYQIDKEMVHHPEHYQGCCMEVMDVLENFFTEEERQSGTGPDEG